MARPPLRRPNSSSHPLRGGCLTGQLQSVSLGTDGQLSYNTVPVIGNADVDGKHVSLSVSLLSVQVATLSGSLAGDNLTLTGGATGREAGTIVFARSDLRAYTRQVNTLKARSQEILASRAADAARVQAGREEQQFVAGITEILSRMQRFDSEADVHLARFPRVEQRHRALTLKMQEYCERQRQLSCHPDTGAPRGQLSVQINQGSIATEQLHHEALELQSTFVHNVGPITKQITAYALSCRDTRTFPRSEARSTACRQFLNAEPLYQRKYEAVSRGIAQLENTYQQEMETQTRLIWASKKLE